MDGIFVGEEGELLGEFKLKGRFERLGGMMQGVVEEFASRAEGAFCFQLFDQDENFSPVNDRLSHQFAGFFDLRTSMTGLLRGGHAPSPFSVDDDDGMIKNSLISGTIPNGQCAGL